MATEIISTRLPKQQIKDIDKFAKEEDLDRSTFIKRLVGKSLDEYKIAYAFKLYQEGKISFGRAAQLANRTYWDMLDLMKKYNVNLTYNVEDLKKDFKVISSL